MKIQVKNKQRNIANASWFLSLVFLLLMILPFVENNPLTGVWAIAFLGLFILVVCLVVAFIFTSRAKKMDKLLNGSELLFHWDFDDEMLQLYVNQQAKALKEKNKAIMWVISILFIVIGAPFLFILEDDELMFFLSIYGGVFFIVLIASVFFPWYYKTQNKKGDKQILIGANYAYINGYFHNWDFPLSGIEKIKTITKPFYGIQLVYYYTDRTGPHSHKLEIPVPYTRNHNEVAAKLVEHSMKTK